MGHGRRRRCGDAGSTMSAPLRVVRVWRGLVAPTSVDVYLGHFDREVTPALLATSGFLGAGILCREVDAGLELVVTTVWESLDPIRAFAGEDVLRAVVHPDAHAALLQFDERVTHYEVIQAVNR